MSYRRRSTNSTSQYFLVPTELYLQAHPYHEPPQPIIPFRLLDLPSELIMMIAERLDYPDCFNDLKTLIEVTYFHSSLFISVLARHFRRVDNPPPILWAARNGYPLLAQRLIENGADIEARTRSQQTPLSWAAMGGHVDVMRLLLDNGCDMYADIVVEENGFKEGYMAFHAATLCRQKESVQLLIDYGFDVNRASILSGHTALHIVTGQAYNDIAQILLDNGADVNVQCPCGFSPLILAASHGHLQTMELMLAAHASIDLRGPKGETALHHASANKDVDAVRLLLNAGAAINAIDAQGLTALHWVFAGDEISQENHKPVTDIAELLLGEGVDVNVQGIHGTTVLHLLAVGLNLRHESQLLYADVINLVLAEGGNKYLTDISGRRPDLERLYGYLGAGKRWEKYNGTAPWGIYESDECILGVAGC